MVFNIDEKDWIYDVQVHVKEMVVFDFDVKTCKFNQWRN